MEHTAEGKDSGGFPWYNFILPGMAQVSGGAFVRGLLFLVPALGTAVLALCLNRYFYLDHLWRFKSLEMPSTFIHEFYACKQATLYRFVGIYLLVGLLSTIDESRRRSPQERKAE